MNQVNQHHEIHASRPVRELLPHHLRTPWMRSKKSNLTPQISYFQEIIAYPLISMKISPRDQETQKFRKY